MSEEEKPSEFTELVRRVRVPDSFIFGPDYTYGALAFSAAGKMSYSGGTYATLRDPYCNLVSISYANSGLGAAPDGIMVRLFIKRDQKSPLQSDVVILTLGTGTFVLPLFCQIYGCAAYCVNSAGTAFPTNVGYATCVNFS